LQIEPSVSPRLEFLPEMVADDRVAMPAPPGGAVPALLGASVLAIGLGAVAAAGFVADQFARGPIIGWIASAIALAGFGLIAVGVRRELRGLFALRAVDHLRMALMSEDAGTVRRAARDWVALVPDPPELDRALAALDEPVAIRALLRANLSGELRARTDRLARTAALQSVAIVAAVPSAGLDALAIGWRGLRLVREIATAHGVRPGGLATIALLRRTAMAAASVAVTDMAVNALAQAVVSNPLLRHVLGDAAAAGVAARRLLILARAAALACSPLPPESE
jgi:uncharacterized membrane protein YcjF (UPF0283 family)